MYLIDIDYTHPFGRISITYEREDYLSEKEIVEEEQIVSQLKERAAIFNKMAELIEKEGFPDLHPSNYKIPEEAYPCYTLAPTMDCGIHDIPCNLIIGGNWANLPPEEVKGNYPKPRKVRDILMGYLGLNEDREGPMEPFIVYKIFDDYFNFEGNHRLYVARLLGLPTVRVRVYEVDYLRLLKNSKIIDYQNFSCLGIREEDGRYRLYDITSKEKERYIQLKNIFSETLQ